MKKTVFLFLFVLLSAMALVPVLFTMVFHDSNSKEWQPEEEIELQTDPYKNIPVKIYRSSLKTVETYPLEEYVRGVVAAEMPIEFEKEALKAQAIAARTYIINRILDKNATDAPEGAIVTDTVKHQVFLSEKELKQMWGLKFSEQMSKLNEAVNETSGQVITYQGKPITALYFSTSNGYTENSEDYWGKEVPYLKSVPSPWDTDSPKYEKTVSIPFKTLETKLKVDAGVSVSSGKEWIKVLERTQGQRIKKIQVGEKVFSGRELRELLQLPSTSITWEVQKDSVSFQTKGYGHGVGMSQYGANGMAKEGKTDREIIQYYYTGVELTKIDNWIKK